MATAGVKGLVTRSLLLPASAVLSAWLGYWKNKTRSTAVSEKAERYAQCWCKKIFRYACFCKRRHLSAPHLILDASTNHRPHLRRHHVSLPRPFTPDLKLITFTNTFLHSLSGSIWTAFAEDLGLAPDVAGTGVCLFQFLRLYTVGFWLSSAR